jgi:hypothetical protein
MRKFNTFGLRWTCNIGPFNIKEHSVITIMAGISINYAYSTNAILALQGEPFYNLKMSWGFQLLFTISSQVIGLGMAGLFRRFLVSLMLLIPLDSKRRLASQTIHPWWYYVLGRDQMKVALSLSSLATARTALRQGLVVVVLNV